MSVKRLLLIEFLSDNPLLQFRSEEYAFIQGFARSLGINTKWISLKAGRNARRDNEFIVELPREDRELLISEVKKFSPEIVILNEKIGLLLSTALKKALHDGKFLTIAENVPRYRQIETEWVLEWLGIKSDNNNKRKLLADNAIPDYDCDLIKQELTGIEIFIPIQADIPCIYSKRFDKNPFFKDVDLSRARRSTGCSFCQGINPEDAPRVKTNPVSLAILQIKRFQETATEWRRNNKFMINGVRVFHKLKFFFERIFSLNLPESEFHFSLRVDEFLKNLSQLTEILPELRKHGHSIHIWSIGVENFSPVENKRLNKGLTKKMIFRAYDVFKKLEQDFPETFFFSKHGGFGMILFTPCITISDLKINLKTIKELGLQNEKFLFTTRIQLLEGSPASILAKHDGLITDQFPDIPFIEASCINFWDMKEIPWKFKHPETALIHRILIRVLLSPLIPESDPLFQRIQEILGRISPEKRNRFDILSTILCLKKNDFKDEDSLLKNLENILMRDAMPVPSKAGMRPLQNNNKQSTNVARLSSLLSSFTFNGYKVSRIWEEQAEGGGIFPAVLLLKGESKIIVYLFPAETKRPCYDRAGRFLISYNKDTPPDTPEKQKALTEIVKMLNLHYS